MKTSMKLILALALLLSATAVTFAQTRPLYNAANSNDPATAGGGSVGYNQMVNNGQY
ncbi:MAG: hypothetical protein ABSC37_12730 [Xanthobacteraceae bacterium]